MHSAPRMTINRGFPKTTCETTPAQSKTCPLSGSALLGGYGPHPPQLFVEPSEQAGSHSRPERPKTRIGSARPSTCPVAGGGQLPRPEGCKAGKESSITAPERPLSTEPPRGHQSIRPKE